jgi:putative sugar O-methyltransferase
MNLYVNYLKRNNSIKIKIKIMNEYSHVLTASNAIKCDHAFNNFKTDPNFTSILEHVSYQQGLEYINEIKTYSNWNSLNWNIFLENDTIGNPQTYNYSNELNELKLNTFDISPSTLRYICFGIKILDYIKSFNKTELSIVEVGGGYGGQCKILFDLCELSGITISKYTIIDLTEITLLQSKFLKKLNYENVNTIPFDGCDKLLDSYYDLFISNYALGEFTFDVKEFYINRVLPKCNRYFITWNTRPIHDYFNNSKFVDESPQTNPTQFKNIIITN